MRMKWLNANEKTMERNEKFDVSASRTKNTEKICAHNPLFVTSVSKDIIKNKRHRLIDSLKSTRGCRSKAMTASNRRPIEVINRSHSRRNGFYSKMKSRNYISFIFSQHQRFNLHGSRQHTSPNTNCSTTHAYTSEMDATRACRRTISVLLLYHVYSKVQQNFR